LEKVIGVVKAYTTRVGGGPFPTEQLNEIGEKLQTIGFEVGVTTGRKRRCGWLDLVVMRYSCMVNGYTSLNITKLDILDSFPEIQVAIAYNLDGVPLTSFPADLNVLDKVTVQYKTLAGWNTDISQCRSYSELPANAKLYLQFIEDFLETKIEWVGVGPARDAMIHIP